MADDDPNSQAPDFSGMTSDAETDTQQPIMSRGNVPELADLLKNMASTRAQAPPQQQTNQVPQPGLPNIVQFIGGLINPSSPRFNPVGSATGARAPVFENFIANTLYALGQGFANEGHGPGAAMRGAGAAATAPYERQVQNFQLQNQANQQQAQTGLAQAQGGLVGAQTQEAELNAQMLKRRMGMMDSANPQDAINGLGQLSSDEQAQVAAARTESNMKGDYSPLLQVVEKISNNRAISGRAGPSAIIEDGDSKSGFSKVVYDKTGKNIIQVTRDIAPPAGMAAKTTTSQHLVQDANGNYNVVTLTGTSTPNLPKKTGGSSLPGSLNKPGNGGGGQPAGGGTGGGSLPGSLRTGGGARPVTNARPVAAAGGGVLQGKTAADMGYAYDQDNHLVYMSRAEATAPGSGFSQFDKATPAEVKNDKGALRMLNDVQANKSRYAEAAANYFKNGGNYAQDASNIAQIISANPFSIGPVSLPAADQLNKVENSRAYTALTPAGKELVDGYYRASAAVPAYQKALTNVGRSNKEMLDLELANIPQPLLAIPDISRKLVAFQENIDRATEGMPRFKDIQQPTDIRKQYEPSWANPSKNTGKWNARSGRYE